MAKLAYGGFELLEKDLAKLGRSSVRRIIEAGAEAAVESTRANIDRHHHVVTGQMRESVQKGKYHEGLIESYMDVYPQGTDSRGVSQARKAFVINYGYGGRKTRKTGDRFITGAGRKKTASAVAAAMKEENQKIIDEINGGT